MTDTDLISYNSCVEETRKFLRQSIESARDAHVLNLATRAVAMSNLAIAASNLVVATAISRQTWRPGGCLQ